MPTSKNAHEPPSPQDRTRGLAQDRTGAAIALLIAGGLILLVVGMAYFVTLAVPAELQDRGQVVGL